jgi:hypothetical protein
LATAIKTEIEITKTVSGVRLTLTDEEASTLAAILSKVGGPIEGYRGNSQEVLSALQSVGYDWDGTPQYKQLAGLRSLYFSGIKGF